MEEKMNVLNVRLDNYTAKEAMHAVIGYMQTEAVNTVEIVTAGSLMQAAQTVGLKEDIEEQDLVMAGDTAILRAAGISEQKRLQEAQEQVFVKMLLRYFHKNGWKVFLLTDTEEQEERLRIYIEEDEGIRLAGSAVVPEGAEAGDQITNMVNGTEAECVVACMSSPAREQFVQRVRKVVNVRLWVGIEPEALLVPERKNLRERMQEFVEHQIMKREIKKEKKRREH